MKKLLLVVVLMTAANLSCSFNPGRVRVVDAEIVDVTEDIVDYNTPAVRVKWGHRMYTNPDLFGIASNRDTWQVVGNEEGLKKIISLKGKVVKFRYRSIDEDERIVLLVLINEIPEI